MALAIKICFKGAGGHLRSSEGDVRRSTLGVVYHRDGRLIRPKLGHLFVFKELKDAVRYRQPREDSSHEFWWVEANGLKKLEARFMLHNLYDVDGLKKFWKKVFLPESWRHIFRYAPVVHTDTGVHGCTSLRMVRKVTDAEMNAVRL